MHHQGFEGQEQYETENGNPDNTHYVYCWSPVKKEQQQRQTHGWYEWKKAAFFGYIRFLL